VTLLGTNAHFTVVHTTSVRAPTSLEQAFLQLHPLDHWAVSSLKCKDEGTSIAALIRNNEAIAVSDGSYGTGISTHNSKITNLAGFSGQLPYGSGSF
jgi:hypothetical protein